MRIRIRITFLVPDPYQKLGWTRIRVKWYGYGSKSNLKPLKTQNKTPTKRFFYNLGKKQRSFYFILGTIGVERLSCLFKAVPTISLLKAKKKSIFLVISMKSVLINNFTFSDLKMVNSFSWGRSRPHLAGAGDDRSRPRKWRLRTGSKPTYTKICWIGLRVSKKSNKLRYSVPVTYKIW